MFFKTAKRDRSLELTIFVFLNISGRVASWESIQAFAFLQHDQNACFLERLENLYEIFKVDCYPVFRKQKKGLEHYGYDFKNNGSLQKL